MSDLFDTIDAYIAAAKAKAKDIADKAADVAEAFAAWLRAQSQTKAVGASPADATRIAALEAECQALAPTVGASPTVGKIDFARLLELVKYILGLLK